MANRNPSDLPVLLLAGLLAAPVAAEEEPKTVTATAGPQYDAGGFHRWAFGNDYRDLWTTPIQVPVLDLQGFAGGLTPVRRVGGQQTLGLALKGADGKDYTFRGVDKDPSSVLPPDLEGSIADDIVQDQIAASHPAAPVVADPILAAAGIPNPAHQLVVMPDDPALGEHQKNFAGVLGTIEEYPQAGFAGSTEIIDREEMWKRLEASPADRVDARAYLRARLVDLLIGDWDRHRKQWRWARIPGREGWQPIPEDRDQAFSRFEGVVLSSARQRVPRFVKFGDEYPSIVGLTWNGWDVDRYLLTELEWPVWEETARDLQSRITDAVIDEAVARMPAEYRERDGARLARALKKRRDALPDAARRFYKLLAGKVDVQMTDRDEVVTVRHLGSGDAEVAVALRDASGAAGEPWFSRVFRRNETDEVRLYLRGGDDLVVSEGGPTRIVVRAIGADGKDALDDSRGGGTRFYDTGGADVKEGSGTSLRTHPYVPPPPNPKAPWIPPRDWGARWLRDPWVSAGPDIGVFLGMTLIREGYGFRKDPFASRQLFGAGYATGANRPRFEYHGTFQSENSGRSFSVFARASGIEVLRFYGFGNETRRFQGSEFFRIQQAQYLLEPAVNFRLTPRVHFGVGPVVQYVDTEQDPERFIGLTQPYGSDRFGQIGAHATLAFDSRDFPMAATRGVHLSVGGRAFAEAWDAEEAFGEVHGQAAAHVGNPAITLSVRGGGKHVMGRYPFYEAAFVGGGSTVRGLDPQRFAGDSALWGNAELRVRLGRVFLLLPADLGLFALGDVGRVYLEGEDSDEWHPAWGGGLWLAFLNRNNTVTFTVARSDERTGVYLRAGFVF